jgi:hypothetical protein
MRPIGLQDIRRSIIQKFSTAGLMGGFNGHRVFWRIRSKTLAVNTVCMMVVDAEVTTRGADVKRLLW